ncbi:MAG: transpeptidase family protein [Bacteroidales bacterium]|nr:transpeptidase family protein [Bacteroidales bacterium]
MIQPKREILWRVYIVYAVCLIAGIVILARIIQLQTKYRDELLEMAKKQEVRVFDIPAMRGNIYSADGSMLATTVPIFEVRMDVASELIDDVTFNTKVDSLAEGLSRILGTKGKREFLQDLRRERMEGNRYWLIKNQATYAEVKALKQLPIFNRGKYKGGLILNPGSKREKPFKDLANRTIGYENSRENLFVGIEGAYHDILKGTNGRQVKRRINHGDWVPLYDENDVEPVNGYDIVSTIDVNIQDVAQNALRKNLIENEAEQGCAILMEVATGQIVAISNLSLDKKTKTYNETYNYSIAESVEPGSTFKLASMLVLLNDNKVRPRDSMNIGNGQMNYYSRTMKDVHPIRNGRITVREAFEKSSNVAISKLVWNAYKDQPSKYVDALYRMGLNQPLGLDIPGERKPNIKHPSNKQTWSGVTLPWMSIGYEITITPLQMLTLYNAVANGGKMVKPQFIKEIRNGNIVIRRFEPIVINEAIASGPAIDSARKLLEGVVERGTAKALSNSPFKIAGKTGTAQIASGKSGYNKQNYTASFAGYFPAGNPKYSCIVMVSNPSAGKIYGGAVAAPVFKEIADKVYATRPGIHDGFEKTRHDSLTVPAIPGKCFAADAYQLYDFLGVSSNPNMKNNAWVETQAQKYSMLFKPAEVRQGTIPDMKGMNARDAVYLLENMGYKAMISGKGRVAAQSVEPGTYGFQGQTVELTLMM